MNYKENFERWCLDCVRIHDKLTGQSIPFRLNAPQRRVAALMESQRRAGKPIRLIMLKSRQWGGSTLVQIYMAWMQLVRHTGWNSLICSHVKDASANIRGMYSHLLTHYPEDMRGSVSNPKKWVFTPYERSSNVGYIPARDCRVAVTSAYAPDSVRGGNYQMAHLSEVAFWGDGDDDVASRIVRTVGGTVPLEPDTVVVMESTADGTDNYFHREWQRAVKGLSDKTPVFIPWHEIEIYTLRLSKEERKSYPAKFDEYELWLLHHKQLSLEQVAWYHRKRREYATHELMMAEYPTTPEEAFAFVGNPWLTPSESERLTVRSSGMEAADRMLLLLVGSKRENGCCLGVAERYPSGEIMLSECKEVEGSVNDAIRLARKKALELGARCGVMRLSDSEVSASRVMRSIRDNDLPLSTLLVDDGVTDEEETLLEMSPKITAELRDRWHELLMDGRWKEPSENAVKSLRRMKAREGNRSPQTLLRLAASLLASPASPPLSPADFL